jgi:WD40 repeat protein
VTALAFSADGKQVLSLSGDYVVKTWPATHGPEALALKCRGANHAAFSPDGRYVAAAANHASKKDWTGVVWDTATGEEVVGFGTESGEMLQLAYSPNGRFIAVAIADMGANVGYVRIWDVAAGKFDRRFPDEKQEPIGPSFAVAYSPNGKLLAAAGADRLVHVWDTTTRVEKFRLTGHPCSLTGLAFSRDSRRLASATGGLSWEVSPSDKNPLNLKSDPWRGPDDVKVWDMDTGKELLALKLPQRPQGMALSPDGDVVAVTASDKTVRLYDVATGKETLVLRGHTQSPRAVAFSPDGKRIVTGGGSDRSVRLWDARTGEEILTFSPVADPVTGVAFSPDGHKIVATSQTDDVVKVWDATPVKR